MGTPSVFTVELPFWRVSLSERVLQKHCMATESASLAVSTSVG